MSAYLQQATSAIQSTYHSVAKTVHQLVTESEHNPSDGYSFIPSYGATADSSTAPASGQQRLGPDAAKIEPKVWLASERTFLNWLRVALLISSFGLTLFNASVGGKNVLGQTMGIVYTFLAVGMVFYAYGMQQRRRHRIIYRFSGHHDDLYGPVFVCLLIFAAVLMNFILRVHQREELRGLPGPKNPWLLSATALDSAEARRNPYAVIVQMVGSALSF